MYPRREHHKVQQRPQDGSSFPYFKDADVHIIISGPRPYLLHSSILKEISPKLKELLSDENTAEITTAAIKKGVTIRNRLQAVQNHDIYADIDIILVPVALNGEGKPVNNQPIPLDLENGIDVPPVYTAYGIVLGAFYGREVALGEFENSSLTDILEAAVHIIHVAEYLEVIHIITKPLEATLMAYGQLLQRSIANNPAAWLDFACRIQSRPIFREALIHGAAQYNTKNMQEFVKVSTSNAVLDIVARKAGTLKEALQQAQLNLLSYYPAQLQRRRTIGFAEPDHYSRSSYGNDILTWIAMTILRHWASQNVAGDHTHHADDMGFAFISKIGQGGVAYLNPIDYERFHESFPMSSKAKSVVQSQLLEMKKHVKRFAQDLLKNNSQLDVKEYNHKYFTCTEVTGGDYPWIHAVDTRMQTLDGTEEESTLFISEAE